MSKNNKQEESLGIAGKTARSFINSPLSPLLLLVSLAIGIIGLILTPRQEDPQISVPMVDVFVKYPGASSSQVTSLATEPLERMLSEITGIKHVYSASQKEQAMVTVEFDVGQEMENSILKVYDKIHSNTDKMPPGVKGAIVKPKGVDDVPVVTFTLHSDQIDDNQLRLLALDVLQKIKEIPNTSQSFIVGGRASQLKIEPSPERLSGFGVTLDQLAQTISTANSQYGVGNFESWDKTFSLYTGSFLKNAEDIEQLVITVTNGVPVYVADVATITNGAADRTNIVQYYKGQSHENKRLKAHGTSAVTIAVAKKKGSNGVLVANEVIEKVESLKGQLIPENVHTEITRNYGQTADDKVNELIFKLFMATGIVTILVWLFLGMRAALVVLIVIPVVILITVFAALLLNMTIDRVSLFALIFSIGILVDDAIVVVENIYRRWLADGKMNTKISVSAVAEVGNPTILATFTVIAALLPMGFVRGMMGPYMAPIPALGSVAMLFSLFAAFSFTPWLVMRIRPSLKYLQNAQQKEHKQESFLNNLYKKIIIPLITKPILGKLFLGFLFLIFFVSVFLFYTKSVKVKMLPLDNKPEFNVLVNFPAGTSLIKTANFNHLVAEELLKIKEVSAIQSYAGTASPFNFNGLVRHFYLRKEPWQGDLQVQLINKNKRDKTSHQLAVQARNIIKPMASKYGVKVQVIEMPPGPPVLQSVVAEVYGPSADIRRKVASDIENMFVRAKNLTDVDTLMQKNYDTWHFKVDVEKALRKGVSTETINRNLKMAMGGHSLGDIKAKNILETHHIVLQLPFARRGEISNLGNLPIRTNNNNIIALSELGTFVKNKQEDIIFHKDLKPLEFVTAEVQNPYPAPVYGMFEVQDLLKDYISPDGVKIEPHWFGAPSSTVNSTFEWTGEWTVTYETFRDMGLAFAVAIILIYMLVVWEFQNFILPAIIISPIPLTLVGIIPGHWLFGAEFTATSMIGFIALAGIIVRNSILLVDCGKNQIQQGKNALDAIIYSCQVRTRPILITAFALMGGSLVILTDPIFQGMAISLFFGIFVSTVLTLIIIPLGCISAKKHFLPDDNDNNGSNNPQKSNILRTLKKVVTTKTNFSSFSSSLKDFIGFLLGGFLISSKQLIPSAIRKIITKKDKKINETSKDITNTTEKRTIVTPHNKSTIKKTKNKNINDTSPKKNVKDSPPKTNKTKSVTKHNKKPRGIKLKKL
jgi:multidrug efflux pump subunit AcrB